MKLENSYRLIEMTTKVKTLVATVEWDTKLLTVQ